MYVKLYNFNHLNRLQMDFDCYDFYLTIKMASRKNWMHTCMLEKKCNWIWGKTLTDII